MFIFVWFWMSLCVYMLVCVFVFWPFFCNWRQQSLDFMISVFIFVWFWMSLCVYVVVCVFVYWPFFANCALICRYLYFSFFVVLDVSVCICLFFVFSVSHFLHLATTKPYTSNTVLSKLYLYLHCTSKGDVAQMLFLHYFDFAIVFMFTLSWCPYFVEARLVVD